jgi:hypothetical protein
MIFEDLCVKIFRQYNVKHSLILKVSGQMDFKFKFYVKFLAGIIGQNRFPMDSSFFGVFQDSPYLQSQCRMQNFVPEGFACDIGFAGRGSLEKPQKTMNPSGIYFDR